MQQFVRAWVGTSALRTPTHAREGSRAQRCATPHSASALRSSIVHVDVEGWCVTPTPMHAYKLLVEISMLHISSNGTASAMLARRHVAARAHLVLGCVVGSSVAALQASLTALQTFYTHCAAYVKPSPLAVHSSFYRAPWSVHQQHTVLVLDPLAASVAAPATACCGAMKGSPAAGATNRAVGAAAIVSEFTAQLHCLHATVAALVTATRAQPIQPCSSVAGSKAPRHKSVAMLDTRLAVVEAECAGGVWKAVITAWMCTYGVHVAGVEPLLIHIPRCLPTIHRIDSCKVALLPFGMQPVPSHSASSASSASSAGRSGHRPPPAATTLRLGHTHTPRNTSCCAPRCAIL
jgi:hypothetical protein